MEPRALEEDAPFDLVVSTTPDARKTTSHPTFLATDASLVHLVETPARLSCLGSYDGWLAAGGAERLFLTHLAAGLDRPVLEPGPLPASLLPGAADDAELRRAVAILAGYFEVWRAAEEARDAETEAPRIDVVMRTGGRPLTIVRRAVRSLERQTAGRIRLLLVRHGPVDLSALRPAGRLAEIVVIDAPGANRARALAAGLRQATGPYFAILDDDDYLLSGHFAGLLGAMRRAESDHRIAYCDILRFDEAAAPGTGRLSLLREGPAHGALPSIIARFSSHCFLATSATLRTLRLDHWALATGEDSLLVAALLRRAVPLHAPGATAVYSQGRDDVSAFLEHPQRRADELALYAETAPWRAEIECRFSLAPPEGWSLVSETARRLAAAEAGDLEARTFTAAEPATAERIVFGPAFHGGAAGGEDELFVTAPLGGGLAQGRNLSPDGAASGPLDPWEVGLRLDLGDFAMDGCRTKLVLTLADIEDPLWCGLLDDAGAMIHRVRAQGGSDPVVAVVAAPPGAPLRSAIVQAGPDGSGGWRIVECRAGYRLSELRAAFGAAEEEPAAALAARLLDVIDRQVTGRPAQPTRQAAQVDIGSARNVFRGSMERDAARTGVVLGSGRVSWDYFAQVHIPAEALRSAQWVRASLADTSEPFMAFLVDEAFERNLSDPSPVRADKAHVDLWFPAPQEAGGCYLVLQAKDNPKDRPLVLVGVTTERAEDGDA
jgi:hypothetical protein